jgi:hypothetical protein
LCFIEGKFCNVAARPVNKGLGRLQMSVAKLNLQWARRNYGVAFGAVAELCRISVGDVVSASSS